MRRWQSLLWRSALAVLLLMALWNPSVPWGSRSVDLIVVVDESLSMGGGLSADAWSRIGEIAEGLPPKSRFSLVRFGANSQVEVTPQSVSDDAIRALLSAPVLPRRHFIDRTSTDIKSALQMAIRLSDPERDAIILLVSDGKDLEGGAEEILRLVRDSGIRTYWFTTGSGPQDHDSWIDSVQLPEQVRAGQEFPITVTVNSTEPTEARLVVLIDGTVVQERRLSIEIDQPNQVQFWVAPKSPGTFLIEAILEAPEDPNSLNNRRSGVVQVLGRASVLYVSRAMERPTIVRSLEMSGWIVDQIQPSEFAADVRDLKRFAVIALDDVAVSDLSQHAWTQLAKTVRLGGTGLVVLGGPNSFGLGSYFNSQLESLLPVTAESADPDDRAAVLFLVDKSGSMGREAFGVSRFDYARLAIKETAKSLDQDDLVGLVWFDAEPREAMRLETHDNLSLRIENAWNVRPSGGTILGPAIRKAIEDLSRVSERQRLLVVVTDGFLADSEDLGDLRTELAANEIDLVVIMIGANQQAGYLQDLSRSRNGLFLRVAEVAELPNLMRPAVDAWRRPFSLAPVTPIQTLALPFLPGPQTWPELNGYMVTKARPTSEVYLTSERGDPLLAMHHIGAARVVALPGGLGVWADPWTQWSNWGPFINGLFQWVSARSADPYVHLQVEDHPGELAFEVDAVGLDLDWTTSMSARLTVLGPDGEGRDTNLKQIAPGRFRGHVPTGPTGVYVATLHVGDTILSRPVLHTADQEILSIQRSADDLRTLVRKGVISLWSPDIDFLDGQRGHRQALRFLLIGLVSLFYVLFLVQEKIGWQVTHGWKAVCSRLRRRIGAL